MAHITDFSNSKNKKFIFRSLSASAQLSRLFQFELELSCADADLKLGDMLGQTVTIVIDQNGNKRYFHGYINRFATVREEDRLTVYHATLVPWLWLLTRTSNCKVFSGKAVPDIVKEVCKGHGFSDIEDKLTRTCRKRDYTVQYQETDFNFISRLLEEEGIYYYFKHDNNKHTLVLADGLSGHVAPTGYATVPFFPPANTGQRERDHISAWRSSKQIVSGAYVINDFNFETSKADLKAKLTWKAGHTSDEYEIYDYPGEYTTAAEGNDYVKVRMQAFQAEHEQFVGGGDVVGLYAGSLFTLKDGPRKDYDQKYLVTAENCTVTGIGDGEVDNQQHGVDVSTSLLAILSTVNYRPPRSTPKPIVQGPQTAMVVGASGDEIYTDKYGRIKVQFHWDRLGKKDENSSCWIRVAHVWAGKNWGGIHIPRVGQEVLVEFLEGDPDRPIITGAVYNNDNMPPYELPDNKTQSGVKSRSTKDGTPDNFNEIRFEDKKGHEQVYIHAEKNQDIVVENDETHSVGHDRRKTIDHDETVTIGNNRTESVGKNESISIAENRSESVGKDETISIGNNRTENVGKNESVTVGDSRDYTVSKNASLTIGENNETSVGKDDTLTVGKSYAMNVGDEITLRVGSASITMKKNGDITIKGNNISIEGSSKINAKAGGDIIMKGSSIKQN